MPRDDSILITGLGNSPKSRDLQEKREEALKQKTSERIALEPYEVIVKELIERELSEAKDVESLQITQDSTEETYKALVMARKMNIEFIKAFQTRLSNKLRETRSK